MPMRSIVQDHRKGCAHISFPLRKFIDNDEEKKIFLDTQKRDRLCIYARRFSFVLRTSAPRARGGGVHFRRRAQKIGLEERSNQKGRSVGPTNGRSRSKNNGAFSRKIERKRQEREARVGRLLMPQEKGTSGVTRTHTRNPAP